MDDLVVKVTPLDNEMTQKKCENEFEILSKLDHPNVVKMKEMHFENNKCYQVMERCLGQTLEQVVAKHTLST